jgi:hypothetical protein
MRACDPDTTFFRKVPDLIAVAGAELAIRNSRYHFYIERSRSRPVYPPNEERLC